MVDYDNIDEITNLLYEFINSKKKDYLFEKSNPETITLNDIIKNNDFDYTKILNNSIIGKENIELIEIMEDKIIIKKNMKSTYPLTLVIQKFDPELKETLSIIDIYYELFMNYIINEYVILDGIPFYLLNICNFNIFYEKLKLIKDFKEIVSEKFKKTKDDDKFCISLYEHYTSYITLTELLSQELSNDEILNILFQVLFAYSYFIYKIGSFRHNNFNIECFLVEKLSEKRSIYLKLGDNNFMIKTMYICKLFNYRRSKIYILENDIKCNIDNPSYDMYTFFMSMVNLDGINKEKIKIIINELISEDIIKKNIKNENIFLKEYDGSIIPNQLLIKNNLFTRFIYMPAKVKRSINQKNPNNKISKTSKPKKISKVSKSKKISKTKKNIFKKSSLKLKRDMIEKKDKKKLSSSSSDEETEDSLEDGMISDDINETIDTENEEERIQDEINTGDEDIEDEDIDEDDDISDDISDDSSEMSGGIGTTDLKKIQKLKNKIDKIKKKYGGSLKSSENVSVSSKSSSKGMSSFGDFIGFGKNEKNNNQENKKTDKSYKMDIKENSVINNGVPLTMEGLDNYGIKNDNAEQGPPVEMGSFLNQMGNNNNKMPLMQQYGANMFQQQAQNVFQQPQYDTNMFQQQYDMNMQQQQQYGNNMMQQQYGNNMLQQPQMNGMVGGKGKSPMPIVPNFFFHLN